MKKIKMDMFSAVMRIIVGLILVGFSVFTLVASAEESKRCSEEVTGTVVRIEEVQRRSRTDYRPVFEYEYNGQLYSFNGYYERTNYYSVGQTKQLRINPNDPTEAYLAQRSSWYVYPILIAGAGMLLFGIYTVKKARSDKQPDIY